MIEKQHQFSNLEQRILTPDFSEIDRAIIAGIITSGRYDNKVVISGGPNLKNELEQ